MGVWWVLAAAAVVSVAVRIPALGAPLEPDEAGYLMVAGQWHAGGGSLYGSYWVDRPPLLIALFGLADLLGGTVALRLLGCLAAATVVLLAALLGRAVAAKDRKDVTAVWTALAALAFVSTPFFGAREVDGELLAAPWVLAGVLAFVVGRRRLARRQGWLLVAGAGAFAAMAFLVKQSFADVFLFVGTWLVAELGLNRNWSVIGRAAGAFAIGAVSMAAVVVAYAAWRGTSPAELWNAVVVFRGEAWHVLSGPSSIRTHRLDRFPGALLVSGSLVVVVLLLGRLAARGRSRRLDPLVVAACVLVLWEAGAALAGGSYWMHYLIGLVPGLTVATAVVVRDAGPLALAGRAAISWAVVSAIAAATVLDVAPHHLTESQAAGEWLEGHQHPGDTAVVAYGRPDVLAEAGMSSPYPQLWSLPVRVLDPRLQELTSVMDGAHPPVWLLAKHDLVMAGIQPAAAQLALSEHYRVVADVCGYRVYLRDGVHRGVRDMPVVCQRSVRASP